MVILLVVQYHQQSNSEAEKFVYDVPDKTRKPSDQIDNTYDFPPNPEQWHPLPIKMPFIPDHSKLIGSTTYSDEPIVLPYNDNSEY